MIASDWRTTHGESRRGQRPSMARHARNSAVHCEYPSNARWSRYGGRGISVSQRWRDSFESFLADVGRKPSPDHSLDRYPNPDGNYEPGNVRWATRAEQNANKTQRQSEISLELAGAAKNLSEWAAETGIPCAVLRKRIGRGWPAERTLTTPVRKN